MHHGVKGDYLRLSVGYPVRFLDFVGQLPLSCSFLLFRMGMSVFFLSHHGLFETCDLLILTGS